MTEMKEIEGYPGYFAHRDGKVFRTVNGEMVELVPSRSIATYNLVRLRGTDGKPRLISRAKVIAEAFLPPREKASYVARHINGDKHDDSAANLVWGDRASMISDKQKARRNQRESIKVMLRKGKTTKEIMEALGVSSHCVYNAGIEIRAEDAVK